jgi:hypothetical protein
MYEIDEDGSVIININELVITPDDAVEITNHFGRTEFIDWEEIVVGIVKNRERKKKQAEEREKEELIGRRRELYRALNNSQVHFLIDKDGLVWPGVYYPPEGFNYNIYHYQFDEFISLLKEYGYSYSDMMDLCHYKNEEPNEFYCYVSKKVEIIEI